MFSEASRKLNEIIDGAVAISKRHHEVHLQQEEEWAKYFNSLSGYSRVLMLAMYRYWGSPCPDYEPDCPYCKAWQSFADTGVVPEL